MSKILQAVHLPGIHTDSLGHYLCGLGLLSAASQNWPSIRGCWRRRHFVLLDAELSSAKLKDFLMHGWSRTPYELWWMSTQKADTNAKSSSGIRRLRGREKFNKIWILDAHIVPIDRNRFNPVLLKGGKKGRRDLAKVCNAAAKALEEPQSKAWLNATLDGDETEPMPDLKGAGTWFVFANKSFNSGQDWSREGRISPWAVLLAMEGALQLSGNVARRLGSRSHPYAVFPFISEPSQPITDGEIGFAKAEFWAPLWDHPATLSEVHVLLQRGLARLGGRAARAPHEFAVAARAAGVDAGVSEFARYELRQTTSSRVYEAIPRSPVIVGKKGRGLSELTTSRTDSDLLIELIDSGWIDRLPYEPSDSKQRGKFIGLRGPIESAIVAIGEEPADAKRWQRLLTLLARSQFRIERNKGLRDRCIALPWLSTAWFDRAWPDAIPGEVTVARAIASVGARTREPLLMNVFGVDLTTDGRPFFPKSRPLRAVWSGADPLRILADIIGRRLTDANPTDPIPLGGTQPCPADLVARLILGDPSLDVERLVRWVPPLALIRWPTPSPRKPNIPGSADGAILVHALMRPLFQPESIRLDGELLFPHDRQPHSGVALKLLHFLRYDVLDEAVRLARNLYLANRRPTVAPPANLRAPGDRIAAALLIPQYPNDIGSAFRRWLQPTKLREE